MASNSSSSDAGKGKRILEELQQKASELSTLLGSETEKEPTATQTNLNNSVSSRTYMPSFRRWFYNSSSNSSNSFRGIKGKGKGKGKSLITGPFMRDLILLPGPDVDKVPRQGKRVWLMENGYMISGFQLQKEWSEYVVEASLREAFQEKIPPLVDFEILLPVHSSLVKPTLAPVALKRRPRRLQTADRADCADWVIFFFSFFNTQNAGSSQRLTCCFSRAFVHTSWRGKVAATVTVSSHK